MSATTASHPGAEPDGPVAQSLRIGFAVLQVAMVLLAAWWAASNIRQVPADNQAVVLRFGQVVRVQQAGLVLAWPRPFERVELLPGAQRQLGLHIEAAQPVGAAIIDPASKARGELPPASAASVLTGDGGVVLLDATLTYRITDAAAYYVSSTHVAPALRRLFLASAVSIAAGRPTDDFLVIRSVSAQQQAQRESLRTALAAELNRRLAGLTVARAGLGIEVSRVDITAYLPPAAKLAFDAVLEAAQMADQGLAVARTEAIRNRQDATQERDQLLTEARANADERVNGARAHVAAIAALEQRIDPAGRPGLLEQLYRERINGILHQAGSVNTVDPGGAGRVILPGGG
jgi:regulator of protease activity HflC (stomatin/prohibitin superfamily)